MRNKHTITPSLHLNWKAALFLAKNDSITKPFTDIYLTQKSKDKIDWKRMHFQIEIENGYQLCQKTTTAIFGIKAKWISDIVAQATAKEEEPTNERKKKSIAQKQAEFTKYDQMQNGMESKWKRFHDKFQFRMLIFESFSQYFSFLLSVSVSVCGYWCRCCWWCCLEHQTKDSMLKMHHPCDLAIKNGSHKMGVDDHLHK